jgi:hypothetical protein
MTRDMLAATSAFINCTGGVDGDIPTEITRTDIDITIRALANNNAYTIMDNIEGRIFALVKSSLMDLKTEVYC